MLKEFINYYKNDGYIYCIGGGLIKLDNGNETRKIVKIGKTCMKIQETEETMLNRLLSRYSTSMPDCYIIHYTRVGNCHLAEKKIFKLLNDIHYKKEHFLYNKKKIEIGFNHIKKQFPDINTIIKNTSVNEVSKINEKLRQVL